MKKIFVAICIIFSCVVHADTTLTSKNYVDDQVATKQDIVPAKDINTVLTHTGESGSIGEKGIYDSTGTYAGHSTELVTAGVADAAIQNAIDTEFVCVEWHENDEHTDANCLGWKIKTKDVNILPAGYTQLEYIENTGTQYINTGVYPSSNFEIYFDGMLLSGGNAGEQFVGTSTGSININWYSATMFASTINGQSSNGGITTGGLNNKFHIGLSPQWLLWHNGTYRTLRRPYSPSGTFMLFRANARLRGRIYDAELYDGNELTFHGIPTYRNSDGVIGMYDTVNRTFLTNAGTGTFVAGPAISYIPQNQ